jgi:hypothetical protein
MQASESSVRGIRTGWAALLTSVASAAIVFELLTGLAVTFGPFHAAVEWSLILHTIAGALTLAPVAWYLWRHFEDYRGQAWSDVLLLGYVALVGLAVCSISGVVVTWQGLLGIRTMAAWRYTHLISTLVTLVAVVPHILLAWIRRRATEFARPAPRWLIYAVAPSAAGILLTATLTYAYSGTKYRNQFPPDYNFVYGKGRPFAPSLARTATNGALDPRSLSGSETCGTSSCHQQIYDEWKASAHRYAAMDSIFQGVQTVMAKQNGPESTRYCGGCHDPISLFSGTKNIFAANLTGLEGYKEGISCLACHSIQKTDIQGNANYTITQPREYLWQWSGAHTAGAVARDFLLRTYPAEHNRLSKRMYKKPEYCAACHKQFIDQEVNRVGWVQLQNQYDNWAASHWNHKGDARKTVECRECHMPLVASNDPAAGDSTDYNRSVHDGKHRSHRFLAANNFMPALLRLDGGQKQIDLTYKWLAGEIEIPEIRDKWAEGAVVKIRIEAPQSAPVGGKFPVRVVLTSNKVGHDYPTGPLDMIQSWVELQVHDDRGTSVYSSGLRDEKNFLQPGTFLFKAEPVDQYGNLIDRHNLWEMVGVRYRRSLFPGYSDTVEYNLVCPSGGPRVAAHEVPNSREFGVPAAAPGTYRIDAVLHYRKIDQFLLNYVMGANSGLTSPVADIAKASATVIVGGTP